VAAVALLAGVVAGFVLPIALRGRVTAAIALGTIVLLAVEVFAVVPGRAREELAAALPSDALAVQTTPAIGFFLTIVVLLAVIVREFILARRPVASTTAPIGADDATGPPA